MSVKDWLSYQEKKDSLPSSGEGECEAINPRVAVRTFARYSELAGWRRHTDLSWTPASTPRTIWHELCRLYPALQSAGTPALVAINRQFADLDHRVQPGDEVSFMPPLSGG